MGRITLARRALWHINRSPLRAGVKALVAAGNGTDKRERRELAQRLAIPDDMRRKARALLSEGHVSVADVVDLGLLKAMAANGAEKTARVRSHMDMQATTHKTFWTRLLDEDMKEGRIDADSIYVRYAIQPAVLQILAAYYQEVPILDYVLLTLSREADGPLSYSQLWHRDHDDVRTVKLFAYLTDVQETGDGPFTFLPGPVSDRFGFSLRSHLPDERVFARVDRTEVRQIKGPCLSTFLVETSRCLHMGSRMGAGRERLLYTATFLSAPRMYPSAGSSFRASRQLSELERKLFQL